jgi:hypothetical protein
LAPPRHARLASNFNPRGRDESLFDAAAQQCTSAGDCMPFVFAGSGCAFGVIGLAPKNIRG